MARASLQRIALLSLHSSPVGPLGRTDVGGMNLYVKRLAEELGDLGLNVDVFTRREDPKQPQIVPLAGGARLIHLTGGPVRRIPKSVLPMHVPSLVTALQRFVDSEGIRYDVVHGHYWLSGLVGLRYCHRLERPAPFIQMFHTLIKLKEFYLHEQDRSDSALRADGERCLINRADAVVGATQSELREMSALYGAAPVRYTVIPPGVDLDLFNRKPMAETRRRLGLTGERVVVFAGRPDPLKGLHTLLRGVAALPMGVRVGVQVVVLGGDDHRNRGDFARPRALAKRLGIENQVEFRGRVEQSILPDYLSAADICAVPSAYESFGTVAIEAMGCQTPVVAFRVGGLATTITDGVTGFLASPGNQEEYAAKLGQALMSPELPTMGRKARMVAQKYRWSDTAERTYRLYESLLDELSIPGFSRYATR